jgi:hypothetical protein
MRCDIVPVTRGTLRYHDRDQPSASAASFSMTFLFRLILVGLLALFVVRGASACESMQRGADLSSAAHAALQVRAAGDRCGVTERTGSHSHRACHASCCAAGCGVHCCAPLTEAHIDARMPVRATLFVHAAALRAGITHAPPLPPPIV